MTDAFFADDNLPLASQWNYYTNSPTSGCNELTSYALLEEILPFGKVLVKKYIIDLISTTGFREQVSYTPTSNSLCTSFANNKCGGVSPYTNDNTMRVTTARLARLRDGPTGIKSAPTNFNESYGILIYNIGPANAYDVTIIDTVGGSGSLLSPTTPPTHCQANWASTGLRVPGSCQITGNTLTFTLDSGVALNGTTTNGYTNSSAIFITFDADFDSGTNCEVKNVVTLNRFAAIPSGTNQGKEDRS